MKKNYHYFEQTRAMGATDYGESCDVWWFFEVNVNGQGWEGGEWES